MRLGIGADHRIGPLFLYPGPGFGGSCFPKDLRALVYIADQVKVPTDLLASVVRVNDRQKKLMFKRISTFFDGKLQGRRIAVWGLAFKPETDDVREAPSLVLIEELVRAGADVICYDPAAAAPAAQTALAAALNAGELARVSFSASARAAVEGADVLVLMTEWKEFRSPDFGWLASTLKARAIFDGRNQYRRETLATHGLAYFGIGRGAPPKPAA